jgi:hypothetical protein
LGPDQVLVDLGELSLIGMEIFNYQSANDPPTQLARRFQTVPTGDGT